MKFSLRDFVLMCIIMCIIIIDGIAGYDSHHHASRNNHSSRRNDHRDRNHHHTSSLKQKLLFPSGKSYYVISPKSASIRDCPGDATFVTLNPRNKKWKKEYEIVKNELEKTKGDVGLFQGFKNVTIEKVFNSCLWYKYKYRKEQVYNEAKVLNEKMLFHASAAPFVSAKKGLDERYTTLEQGELGAGLYFSDNSYKTHTFTKLRDNGTRVIMLCRVTLGNVHEKIKSPHAPVGYQSVSASDGTTMEYSIYRGEQAYPDYVITYRTD